MKSVVRILMHVKLQKLLGLRKHHQLTKNILLRLDANHHRSITIMARTKQTASRYKKLSPYHAPASMVAEAVLRASKSVLGSRGRMGLELSGNEPFVVADNAMSQTFPPKTSN